VGSRGGQRRQRDSGTTSGLAQQLRHRAYVFATAAAHLAKPELDPAEPAEHYLALLTSLLG
jgi:hypothetical protein